MQSIGQRTRIAISLPGVQWKNVFVVVVRRDCEINPMTKLEYFSAHLITPVLITEEKPCVPQIDISLQTFHVIFIIRECTFG